MDPFIKLDNIAISVRSRKILQKILEENPVLDKILRFSVNETEAINAIRNWILPILKRNSAAKYFYESDATKLETFRLLNWQDLAAIRILDYTDHAGEAYADQNIGGELAITNPVKNLWLATNFGSGGANTDFFEDFLHLFRQLNGESVLNPPGKEQVQEWMDKYPSGLDHQIIELRRKNKIRIINKLIEKIYHGDISPGRYRFKPGTTHAQKVENMLEWWDESRFHLHFAVRTPELLNEMLDYTLDEDTMKVLHKAKKKGIPFFVNPYYLSLINVHAPEFAIGTDLAIRCYVVYSEQLVEEFGSIVAWEKEDKVEPGKPNAAGWLLPSHNIHRRYPEVAIFIPDTVGRACGGLCASCQRMYDFQSGRYNFDLKKLKPTESWNERLPKLLSYYKDDALLRDILITGGDALMSSNKSLEQILDQIYNMAVQKREENKKRPSNEKYAEIVRVRIGTRLPIYIPQRITPELTGILARFKEKAMKIGIKQFVIQTHYESPMEVTPESQKAVKLLLDAGWIITNQFVLTTAASRRGHPSKLRQVLNQIGVLSYYTLTVKGFKENKNSFAPNARSVQEKIEEKIFGAISNEEIEMEGDLLKDPNNLIKKIEKLCLKTELPFLATDRSIINLPGVGKSLTFRTIGITRSGRRILEFDHDRTRNHSPIIDKMGKVIIVESKSIKEYLQQLWDMGEDPEDYRDMYGYSIGQTEPRMSIYEYPEYDYKVTKKFSNLEIE